MSKATDQKIHKLGAMPFRAWHGGPDLEQAVADAAFIEYAHTLRWALTIMQKSKKELIALATRPDAPVVFPKVEGELLRAADNLQALAAMASAARARLFGASAAMVTAADSRKANRRAA